MQAAHRVLGTLRSAFRNQPSSLLPAAATCGTTVSCMNFQASFRPCVRPHAVRSLRTLVAWRQAGSLASATDLRGCGNTLLPAAAHAMMPVAVQQPSGGILAQLNQARGLRTLKKRIKVST